MKKKCIIILFNIIALITLSSIAYSENDELVELNSYKEYIKLSNPYPKQGTPERQKYNEAYNQSNQELKNLLTLINENRKMELQGKQIDRSKLTHMPKFDVFNYPLIDGSTSTIPLSLILACKILNIEYKWIWGTSTHARYVGLSRVEAISTNKRLNDIITLSISKHTGTNTAYMRLVEKKADIILVARKPSEDEIKAAKTENVEFEYVPIALDAFVFIENRANPMRKLSTENIKGIYSGKYSNWKDIGGEDIPIVPFQRERNSGSQEMMISEFMKETPIKKAMQDLVVFNMDGPYFGLTEKPYGISYSVYYYEHFQAVSPYTRLIEIDGVLAGYETIRTRKYPYTTEVYEVIRKDEPFGTGVRLLYNWLQTEEGQKLVMESGYVPIN